MLQLTSRQTSAARHTLKKWGFVNDLGPSTLENQVLAARLSTVEPPIQNEIVTFLVSQRATRRRKLCKA